MSAAPDLADIVSPKALRPAPSIYDAATKAMLRVTREQYAREERRVLEQERERNPSSTFTVYRTRAPRKVPPAVRVPTREERVAAERVAKRSAGLAWDDLSQDLLCALAKCEPPENLSAWLHGTARKILATRFKKEGRGFIRPASKHEVASAENDDGGFRNNLSEDDLIRWIDSNRGRVALTKAPDRALFWDVTRAWAAARLRAVLGGSWREIAALNEPTPQDLTAVRVDGGPLAPNVATWAWLYCRRTAPDAIELFSDSTPEDVYERAHATLKKAFQRSKSKIDQHVPAIGLKAQTITLEGGGF